MPEIITCPKCDRKLRVPDDLLGQAVKCPTCAATFTAAGAAAEPPPPPKPRADSVRRRPDTYDVETDDDRDDRRDDRDDYNDRPSRRRRRRYLEPHRGTTILVLGIVSFFVLGPILGPIAWIMGNNDLREMRAGRMDREGEGNTNAGRICGMIATIMSIVGIVGCCLFYAIMFAAMGAAGAGGGNPTPTPTPAPGGRRR